MTKNAETPEAERDTKGGAARMLFFLLLAPIAWGAHSMVMYAAHTVICSLGLSDMRVFGWEAMHAISLLLTLFALALIAAPWIAADTISRWLKIERGRDWLFYRNMAGLLAVLSAAGVGWTGAMSFVIPACLALR